MVRKDFSQYLVDIVVDLKRPKYVKVKKKGKKIRTIPGYGEGPKKKPTYKQRMDRKLKKQIKNAKKAGFKKNKKICIGIGEYIYYPIIVNILKTGKIKVKYYEDDEEIYSLKILKRLKEQGKYIKQMIKERQERRASMRYKFY